MPRMEFHPLEQTEVVSQGETNGKIHVVFSPNFSSKTKIATLKYLFSSNYT